MLKSGSKGVDTAHLCVNTNFSIFSIPQLIRGTRAMIPINSSSELLFNSNVASPDTGLINPICGLTPTFLSFVSTS